MRYNYGHQRWEIYVLKPIDYYLTRLTQTSKHLSKLSLTLIPLLLPYSASTQALSISTSKVINGSKPYLTFDNGVTKIATTDGLLSITISDDTTQTIYTPENNTSTKSNPIVLLKENQSFADIGMMIPLATNSIALNDLIQTPYNYWGDDDGDGQGTNGISAEGDLELTITNRYNKKVSRSDVLNICDAPYAVKLTSTNGSLTTQYGVPNSTNFTSKRVTYYVSPKAEPTVCYAKPLDTTGGLEGPEGMWNHYNGFLLQSTTPSSYERNFPATGADNLQFYLLISGIDATTAKTLTWPAVTQGGITATVSKDVSLVNFAFSQVGDSAIRITFTGPKPTDDQKKSDSPYSLTTPSLPQKFELVGYDNNNRAVLKYGFVLKQWFVGRGDISGNNLEAISWCTSLGGYRLAQRKDLTNASRYHFATRYAGAGLISEWGHMGEYPNTDLTSATYWTADIDTSYTDTDDEHETIFKSRYFSVNPSGGFGSSSSEQKLRMACVYP